MWSTATQQVLQASAGKLCLGSASADTLEAATFFGMIAMIYRKRAFHYFFLKLVAGLANKEMILVCQTIFMAILGHSVVHGHLSVSHAVGAISAMKSLSSAFENFYDIYLNIADGFPSLQMVAHVFNRTTHRESEGGSVDVSLLESQESSSES